MKNNYLSDKDYSFIYSNSPRVCVDLLIKNNAGEIFLTQRSIEPYINHWHFPGGRVRFKESMKDAVLRIAKTELGIELIDTGSIVGICEFLEETQNGEPRHSISIVHKIIFPDNYLLMPEYKYSWFSEIPTPTIPPQKEFLLSNNIL